jgi:hypothetical protein
MTQLVYQHRDGETEDVGEKHGIHQLSVLSFEFSVFSCSLMGARAHLQGFDLPCHIHLKTEN